MVFSSPLFVYWFLPTALLVYYGLPSRGRHLGLTVLSYLFYGWSNPAFMALMLFSTAVDWVCGLVVAGARPGTTPVRLDPDGPRSRRQRAAVAVSVVTNLGLLGFFKYFDFAVGSWSAAAAALGLPDLAIDTALRVTLPLGISFYTFQSMSYTIDVYRGRSAALAGFVDFACFVSLFPQLVAGPILRFSEVADQLRERTHTVEKFARGCAFFSLGMAKKVLLADPCGRLADAAFGAGALGTLDAWIGLFGYSFQIYFDFSGYSDMAIGLGLMLGFVFPKNFDSPYRAESLTDFWRRWHISLSTWLRDYLYIPLGGNRRGPVRTYVHLAVVMLLGGLWHGASWTFVLWGAIHGIGLAAERAFGRRRGVPTLPRPVRVAAVFLLVTLAWIPFRAPDLAAAIAYLSALAGSGSAGPEAVLLSGVIRAPLPLLGLAVAALVAFAGTPTQDWTRRITPVRGTVALGLLGLALVVLETEGYSPFIYFIF